MTRPALIIALALLATSASADPAFKPPKPKEGHAYPECYCTNRGVRVPIGQKSCLRIGSQEFTARCGMSLNNPAWRDMEEGCDDQPLSFTPAPSEFFEPA